jgi:hypothetical protein
MHYSANRVSGVFFLLFGLAMYFLVVPNYVKTVTGSNLAPKTLPNVISIVLALVGAVPGIGPIMAMAIAIPFTFALDPLVAISFLVGVNKGGLVGGVRPGWLSAGQTGQAAESHQDGPVFVDYRGHLQRHRFDHGFSPAGHSGAENGPDRDRRPDDLCLFRSRRANRKFSGQAPRRGLASAVGLPPRKGRPMSI